MASRNVRSTTLAAYVLHRYDWSESSLVIDLWTRDEGRIAVAAKGAKKPFSQLRAALLPFQRLAVTVARAGDDTAEVRNLRAAERSGGAAMPAGAALFSGFYANELLMKLLARHDPHPLLFDAYAATIEALAVDDVAAAPTLRAFELTLLKEIGLLADLGHETATRRPVEPERRYAVHADAGVVETRDESGVDGAALAALQRALDAGDLSLLSQTVAESLGTLGPLLRAALAYHLGGPTLRTRDVMRAARQLTQR